MSHACPHAGASQATNRESIQKSICRLDEDLSTLGQVSKLSETLSFPHQVWGRWSPVGDLRHETSWDVLTETQSLWEGWWSSKDPDATSPEATGGLGQPPKDVTWDGHGA